jgi:histidinol-phosphatase (PHP family)
VRPDGGPGLPSIAFTEHVDHTRSVIPSAATVPAGFTAIGTDGRFQAPPLDVAGYLDCLQRCRSRFPGLRILSGVEIGEPHWFPAHSSALVGTGACAGRPQLAHGDALLPGGVAADDRRRRQLRRARPPGLPLRAWPQHAAAFDPTTLEEEFRAALRALAASERVLEISTGSPSRHRSSAGGTRREARRSVSEATPTAPTRSPGASPTARQ